MANNKNNSTNGAALGFERTLWAAAEFIRGDSPIQQYRLNRISVWVESGSGTAERVLLGVRLF